MASAQSSDAGPLHDQTAFRAHLLAAVYDNPGSKGLKIKEILEEFYGAEINHGRLYPNLTRLAEQGLISKGKLDDRTNTYELTQRGERELRAHVTWWNDMAGDLLD